MTQEMRKEGWFLIVGGPHNGSEYYPPNEPKPLKGVRLGTDQDAPIVYRFNAQCTAVEYAPDGPFKR